VFIRGQKRDIVREVKKCAELRAEYFASMKFSTHVLKSLWKSAALRHLTSLPSTPCCGLHQFSASFLVSSRFQVNKRAPCPQLFGNKNTWRRIPKIARSFVGFNRNAFVLNSEA